MVVPNGSHRRDPALWKRRFPALVVLAPAASRARFEAVNLPTAPPGFTGFVLNYITASIGPLGISRVFRLLALQVRAGYAAFIDSLAAIADLSALSVAHGYAVTEDVAGALRAAAARIHHAS